MESKPDEKPDETGKALIIQPYGNRYYALYEGEELVCVTVYKKGALEVKRRLEMVSDSGQKKDECFGIYRKEKG